MLNLFKWASQIKPRADGDNKHTPPPKYTDNIELWKMAPAPSIQARASAPNIPGWLGGLGICASPFHFSRETRYIELLWQWNTRFDPDGCVLPREECDKWLSMGLIRVMYTWTWDKCGKDMKCAVQRGQTDYSCCEIRCKIRQGPLLQRSPFRGLRWEVLESRTPFISYW